MFFASSSVSPCDHTSNCGQHDTKYLPSRLIFAYSLIVILIFNALTARLFATISLYLRRTGCQMRRRAFLSFCIKEQLYVTV